jgi:hypothetical protein
MTILFLFLSLVKKYLSRKIVTTAFPIHDDEYLKKLGAEWYQMKHAFKPQLFYIQTLFHYEEEIFGLRELA